MSLSFPFQRNQEFLCWKICSPLPFWPLPWLPPMRKWYKYFLSKTILALFSDKYIQHQLIMEKPIAIILDNYSVHHAIFFTELCNILNMDLIHLPPYSPKYNPIEQVWRTIKAKISRKFITSIEQLKFIFKNKFEQVVDNESFWENWLWKFL